MSVFQLDKCLYQLVHDPAAFAAFERNPETAVESYELAAEERAAVLARDLRTLHALGANGYLLAGFAGRLGLFGRAPAAPLASGGH